MSDRSCSHGLIQRDRLGVDVDERGIETCRGCGKPIWESAMKANASVEADRSLHGTTAATEGDPPKRSAASTPAAGYQGDQSSVGRSTARESMAMLLLGGLLIAGVGAIIAAAAARSTTVDTFTGELTDTGSEAGFYLGLFMWGGGLLMALVAVIAFGVSLGMRDAAQRSAKSPTASSSR
jgi:hypothetical protein